MSEHLRGAGGDPARGEEAKGGCHTNDKLQVHQVDSAAEDNLWVLCAPPLLCPLPSHTLYNRHTPLIHPSYTPHTPLIHSSYTPHTPPYTRNTGLIHPSKEIIVVVDVDRPGAIRPTRCHHRPTTPPPPLPPPLALAPRRHRHPRVPTRAAKPLPELYERMSPS